jgi:hypothetical protein
MNSSRRSLRPICGSVILSVLTLPALAAAWNQASTQSIETGIVRALLREWAVPWRAGYKEDPLKPINVFSDSLTPCPPPPEVVRGCITPDVLPRARQEAAKGSWSFDLVSELEKVSKNAVVFRNLDVSGFERVVVGPKAELLQAVGFPLQMSRPAVRGKNALVVVQFAHLSTWLVLLTEKNDAWSVSTKIAWGMGEAFGSRIILAVPRRGAETGRPTGLRERPRPTARERRRW